MYKRFLWVCLLPLFSPAKAQYAPAAGKPGSTALSMDSSIFINWASGCSLQRGWKNIADKDSGYTTIGDSLSATGPAGQNGVVSLGDSGIAICRFPNPIMNGGGWDFAIFENTFDDRFLELAMVEVSSNGWRYFRFPCHSLTDTIKQTGAFGFTEPEQINNLAGKYRYGFGTPFDLDDLPDYKDLDKNHILYVKIVDVVGSLNPAFASFDTANRKINDPWPTPFPSGGFDLDAVGVIHQKSLTGTSFPQTEAMITGPNPILPGQQLTITPGKGPRADLAVYNSLGILTDHRVLGSEAAIITFEELPAGMFFIKLRSEGKLHFYRGLK